MTPYDLAADPLRNVGHGPCPCPLCADARRRGVPSLPGPTCRQCGAPLSPVAVMLGPVCGQCCRANHRAAIGGR